MPPRHIKEWTVSLTEPEAPADITQLCVIITYKPPRHMKEWMVSLTETEVPAKIAFWNTETCKSPHHINEWMASLTEAEAPADIALNNGDIQAPSPHQGMDGFSNRS